MEPSSALLLALVLLALAAWFVLGARRYDRARTAIDTFLADFDGLCDDEAIPEKILEDFQFLFEHARELHNSFHLLSTILRRHLTPWKKRARVNPDTDDWTRTAEPETAKRYIRACVALFSYISYGLPLLGVVIRVLARRDGRLAVRTKNIDTFVALEQQLVRA
ncbi:MAG: hypothetical protein ACHQRJ_12285 [Alphaproteobacteria bacterium]